MCLGLSFVLKRAGFWVISANDALRGIMLAAREKPDLALLDINMPAGGGFSVAKFLRRTPETAATPIVFLTSRTSAATKLRAAELGAAEFLEKPLGISLALGTIRAHMQSESNVVR